MKAYESTVHLTADCRTFGFDFMCCLDNVAKLGTQGRWHSISWAEIHPKEREFFMLLIDELPTLFNWVRDGYTRSASSCESLRDDDCWKNKKCRMGMKAYESTVYLTADCRTFGFDFMCCLDNVAKLGTEGRNSRRKFTQKNCFCF
uniref:Uncharacterized protein n=1 Tax=Rhodnius prolixus TaxID=13249 RepID=T1HZS7_RHOPR